MIFGLFKRRAPPVITREHFQPLDNKITTAEAKKLFRAVLKEHGICQDRQDLSLAVQMFADDMREEGEGLKDDVAGYREDLREYKRHRKELQRKLKTATDDKSREDIEYELESLDEDIADAESELAEFQDKLKTFRSDKRDFLVEALNVQMHGPEIREVKVRR